MSIRSSKEFMWGAVETGVSGCSATGPLLAEGAAGVVAASAATEDTGGAEWCCMGGCSTEAVGTIVNGGLVTGCSVACVSNFAHAQLDAEHNIGNKHLG